MTVHIASLVSVAGGELVGKTRLQKTIYLLDQLGLNSGFEFSYHNFGPYSAELAEAVEDAVVFGDLHPETRRRRSDGAPFVVYSSVAGGPEEGVLERFRPALSVLQSASATVLELASTIHWLINVEGSRDWHSDLVERKGWKAEQGRTEKALDVLSQLGLSVS